jgi:acyl-CoA synthetase (AMP-forming)/AMP-acid ligase II
MAGPVFVAVTMARRGLLWPGPPLRVLRQFGALHRWGFGLAGELRQAAARDPGRVAVIDEERGPVTYGELLDRSEKVARVLPARAGDRVGVLRRNSAAMVETLIGASQLGADPVLINTGLAAAQLGRLAQDQDLSTIVYDDEFAGVPGGFPGSRLDALVDAAPSAPLSPPERPGRTIVLTSGTTGLPKGARRPTPGGFSPLCSIIDRIPLRAGSRILIAAPVMLQQLMAVPSAARPPLSVVAVSGSALPGGLAPRFMDRFGDVLYNLYGSTEASWASIATPADLREAPNTAGRPPHGTVVAVLGDDGRPVPAGTPGRLFIGNEMLFEGYTDGAAGEVHDGLLAIGDVGHLDPAGRVFVDGRADDMIVSGGENVFPSEVENLLADLPEVREVAVIGVPDVEYGQRLAAYLALHEGADLDADAVRSHVRAHRARFCVPRDVVFLDALPRNATGKIVTRELPRVS